MYVATIPNRGSKPTIIIREGYREKGKVKNRTIANITHWPKEKIEALRLVLKGKTMAAADACFEKLSSKHHGHVDAVLKTVKTLGLDTVIAAKPCRERDLIVAVIIARICQPDSKLAMTRWWADTPLPELLHLEGANEDNVYAAMDWLLKRQKRIEKKLATRHLNDGDMVRYDLTSSYFEGVTCPLARRGKSRDRTRNTLQVNYGLVATHDGCPVSVSVYEGNTSDPTTLVAQAQKVRNDFGIGEMVLVGDRGMITQKQIDGLKDIGDMRWMTALKTGGIRKLVSGGTLQLDLFDERNIFAFTHPDYPGERLVACKNAVQGRKRAHTRTSMLEATEQALSKIRTALEKGTLKKAERCKERIGVRVGKIVNRYKMAKHFDLHIQDDPFTFERNLQSIAAEAALDGLYVIRTSVPEHKMDADETVRSYKNLTHVERAFNSLKSINPMVRPIRHATEDRVKAHIFLCMLTYYVQRVMTEALRPLLFADEDLQAKTTRDPVAPATRSTAALEKASSKKLQDGSPVQSFRTLLHHMSTITRDVCSQKNVADPSRTFTIDTPPNHKQRRVLHLLTQVSL